VLYNASYCFSSRLFIVTFVVFIGAITDSYYYFYFARIYICPASCISGPALETVESLNVVFGTVKIKGLSGPAIFVIQLKKWQFQIYINIHG